MVTITTELAPEVSVQPYFRLQCPQYTRDNSRQDMTHSVGGTVGYSFNKWSTIRFSAGFEGRDFSDVAINGYRKLDIGLGLALQAKF